MEEMLDKDKKTILIVDDEQHIVDILVYNLQKARARTEREAIAINIATDVLEIAKSLNYSEVFISNENSEFKTLLNNKYSNLQNSNNTVNCNYSDVNNIHYKIQVTVSNYYPADIEVEDQNDLVKQITAEVMYPVGNSTKSINIAPPPEKIFFTDFNFKCCNSFGICFCSVCFFINF